MEKGMSKSKREEYPLTLTVAEVADILRVDLHKAYGIIGKEGFPAIRDGRRIIIPRDAFFRWLDNCGKNSTTIDADQILRVLSDLIAAHQGNPGTKKI